MFAQSIRSYSRGLKAETEGALWPLSAQIYTA